MGDSSQKPGGWNWGYLIKPDKTATPMLEQLCIGLSRIICKLGPGRIGPEHELRPEQLVTFYRSVGGHLESLFLGPSDTGPSFLYRTLGCFHSLEPSLNPFKTPSVACLTPAGFARWQTIMLLLCPDEHAAYIQQAVKLYDVPRPDGGIFPKRIPRESFPPKSDPEMESWYSHVVQQLRHQQTRRLKNSPHASPNPAAFDGRDGYFGQQIPRVRGPSRNSRDRSSEGELSRLDPDVRRRSEPHILSPGSAGPSTRPPSSYHRDGKMRSPSANPPANRDVSGPRPRSATTGNQSAFQSYTNASSQRRDASDPRARPVSYHVDQSHPYAPRQSRSSRPTSANDDSAEEASSEDSLTQRPGRSRNVSPRPRSKQKNSLFASINPFSHKRRHSHDATPYNDKDDSKKRHEDKTRSEKISPAGSATRQTQHVQFKNDVPQGPRSAQDLVPNPRPPASHRQSRVYPQTAPATETEFPTGHPLTREQSSGSGTDPRSGYDSSRSRRRDSIPLRVSTMSGVGGRRYPSTGPQSAGAQPGSSIPQQDLRARYSTAV